jgi:hypothetical protein
MAMASISGSSSSAPVRTSMEPVKGVKQAESETKSAETKTMVAQENDNKAGKKAEFDAKKQEELKGVKEVDTKV